MDGFDDTPREPPHALLDAIARGEADFEAGRFSPLPEALARLHALQAELEAEHKRRHA